MDQRQPSVAYSPVDRTTRTSRAARRERPKPLNQVADLTLPKLRYLDENEEEEEVSRTVTHQDNEAARRDAVFSRAPPSSSSSRVMFEKCTQKTGESRQQIHNNQQRHQEHLESNDRDYHRQEQIRDADQLNAHKHLNYQNYKHHLPHNHELNREDDIDIDLDLPEHDHPEHDDEDRAPTTSSLEEIYLCSCCGITRPLDPAMKYMPLFRASFVLFNLLTFAFGLANLSMGLWFRIDPKVYEIHKYIETQNFTYAGWIMLAGGFLACMMSLVGFAAASRQSICLLISYALTMTLVTVSLIGALVLLTVYGLGAHLERFMNKEIYEQMRRRTMSSGELDLALLQSSPLPQPSGDAAQFLDFVQVKLRCCGAQDFRDYQKLGMPIPTTCYTIAANHINAPGCGRALRELFDLRAGLASGSTAASVIVQMLAALLASLMVCSIYNWRASPRPAKARHNINPTSSLSRPHSAANSPLPELRV